MLTLCSLGPLSSAVAASDWGLYFGGVFDDCPYDENIEVNHAGANNIKLINELDVKLASWVLEYKVRY